MLRELFLEQEQSSGARLGAGEGEDAYVFPAEVAEAVDEAPWLVAAALDHAKLLGALAGQAHRRNELESVASGKGAIGVDSAGERDSLDLVAVAMDGSTEKALIQL